jgi:hypothetical protein
MYRLATPGTFFVVRIWNRIKRLLARVGVISSVSG